MGKRSHCKAMYRTLLATCEYGVCSKRKRNVPHVACNVWRSEITDVCTYWSCILLYSISAEPHALEQRAVHCLSMTSHLSSYSKC